CTGLKEKLDRYGPPVANVLNGVDAVFLEPVSRTSNPADSPVFVYAGALNRRKGFDTLLEGFALIHDRFPQARLEVAGRGSWEVFYRGKAERLGILPSIDYHGPLSQKDLKPVLDRATAFLFPSQAEGFGLPPLEAMARGCPVVTTLNEGTAEFAKEGDNCLVIDRDSPEPLAMAAIRLVENQALAGSLGARARATAEGFTWDSVADRTEIAMLEQYDRLALPKA
ncbi:MAG: glycosyltransferase family 4 protein, partial [Candidatus Omnitrophica bacterium]|nr:glycosyltransferase family 4 protein [Candidatus Omnitrophota bacterium]